MQFIINTQKDQELINITNDVKKAISAAGIKNGLCNVYTPHTSGAIIINESWDESVCGDILSSLNKLVPLHAGYKHDDVDGNAHAHIKSVILGPSETIHIKDGELQLGRWQGITFCEFDGPRRRTIMVEIVGK